MNIQKRAIRGGIRQAEYKFYKTEDYNYNKKFVIALFSYLTEPCQVKDLFSETPVGVPRMRSVPAYTIFRRRRSRREMIKLSQLRAQAAGDEHVCLSIHHLS